MAWVVCTTRWLGRGHTHKAVDMLLLPSLLQHPSLPPPAPRTSSVQLRAMFSRLLPTRAGSDGGEDVEVPSPLKGPGAPTTTLRPRLLHDAPDAADGEDEARPGDDEVEGTPAIAAAAAPNGTGAAERPRSKCTGQQARARPFRAREARGLLVCVEVGKAERCVAYNRCVVVGGALCVEEYGVRGGGSGPHVCARRVQPFAKRAARHFGIRASDPPTEELCKQLIVVGRLVGPPLDGRLVTAGQNRRTLIAL